MRLRRAGAAVGFAALFVAVIAAFTMSPSVPKTSASEGAVEDNARTLADIAGNTKALAGAFSMLAQDVRAQKLSAEQRDRVEAERNTAVLIALQQLTETAERLTAKLDETGRKP